MINQIPVDTIHLPSSTPSGRYPFSDASRMTATDGTTIPPQLFTDARVYPLNGGPNQYISRISLQVEGVTFTLSDLDTEVLATGFCNYEATSVTLLDDRSRNVGMILGSMSNLRALGKIPFEMEFDENSLVLADACVTLHPSLGVESIRDGEHRIVTGNAWLVGEDGVVLKVDESRPTSPRVTVHLNGDRLYVRRVCEDEEGQYLVPAPLKKIIVRYRGDQFELEPDEFGNINIVPGDGGVLDNLLRINPTQAGIEFGLLNNFE